MPQVLGPWLEQDEKIRDDGKTYDGSQLRRTVNRGNRVVKVLVKGRSTSWHPLGTGTYHRWKHDLVTVSCP